MEGLDRPVEEAPVARVCESPPLDGSGPDGTDGVVLSLDGEDGEGL